MVDKRDVQDAILEANSNLDDVQKEVDSEWNHSDNVAQFAYLWQQLPPQVREALRQQNPKAVAEIEKKYVNGGQ